MQELQIKSSGVFYMEKMKFEDLLFSVGGVNVFLLCIDLLRDLYSDRKESAVSILCEIIDILKILTDGSYQEDTLRFLENNGAYVLAYLLREVI